MPPKPDVSIAIFGAGVLTRHLSALRAEIDGVRAAEDIEYIHRMRVASRRTRSALELFGDTLPEKKLPAWTKRIRQITRALGAARDLDVQIEALDKALAALAEQAGAASQPASNRLRPGLRRLRLRLTQQRDAAQAGVLKALDKLEQAGTLDEMEKRLLPLAALEDQVYLFTPALYQRAFKAISEALDELMSYEPYVAHPECAAELHAMRIAAKHLRYALEPFQPLYEDQLKPVLATVRRMQDALGDLHDCDVWIALLPAFIEDERARAQDYFGHLRPVMPLLPGLRYFEADRTARRARAYDTFAALWAEAQTGGTWDGLRAVIRAPFAVSEAIQQAAEAARDAAAEAKAEAAAQAKAEAKAEAKAAKASRKSKGKKAGERAGEQAEAAAWPEEAVYAPGDAALRQAENTALQKQPETDEQAARHEAQPEPEPSDVASTARAAGAPDEAAA